jgi:hypothetical protein
MQAAMVAEPRVVRPGWLTAIQQIQPAMVASVGAIPASPTATQQIQSVMAVALQYAGLLASPTATLDLSLIRVAMGVNWPTAILAATLIQAAVGAAHVGAHALACPTLIPSMRAGSVGVNPKYELAKSGQFILKCAAPGFRCRIFLVNSLR